MHTAETIVTQLEICTLKARNLRFLDTKQWAGYAAMLTEDFVLDMGQSAVPPIHGRDAAVLQTSRSLEGVTSVHQAHQPEFELKGDEALVTWAMHDRIVRGPGQPSITIYGYHHDRWLRRGGEWKLAALRLSMLHVDTQPGQSSHEKNPKKE
jgi:SnoaL-like protein